MKPTLSVIQGDWVAAPTWLDFPETIEARSPHLRLDTCELRVSKSFVEKAAGLRRRTPAYLLWSALLGVPPPVPHHVENATDGLMHLREAHACFNGLGRPCGDDEQGASFVAFVLKPKVVFEYEFRAPVMLANKVTVPDDVVLMAYAKLDLPKKQYGPAGVLTHWNFVPADPRDLQLPDKHKTRYLGRLW